MSQNNMQCVGLSKLTPFNGTKNTGHGSRELLAFGPLVNQRYHVKLEAARTSAAASDPGQAGQEVTQRNTRESG